MSRSHEIGIVHPARLPIVGTHLKASPREQGRRESGSRIPWAHVLENFGLCLLYVTALWGQAGRLLPAPFDQWHSLLYRALGPWWHAHVAIGLARREQVALYQLVEAIVLAVLVPVWILRRNGLTLRDAGIRIPGRGAAGPAAAVALTSIPVGIYLSRAVPDPWGSPLQEALVLAGVIPEHFLIFGFVGALLLRGGHGTGGRENRRIGRQEAFAIAATALIFGLAHVGVEHRAVLIASFPLGVLNAYVTVRTASIWPAVVAHWMMNLVPMAWDMAGG